MKRCPNCGQNLVRSTYEDLPVEQCESCHGVLVSTQRLETIKRRPDTPQEELHAQIEEVAEASSRHQTRCPKCNLEMKTEYETGSFEVEFDRCARCQLVWLDPGELAMLQLLYEASPKFKNNQRLREAHEELESDPDRLDRYRENVKRLQIRDPVSDEVSAEGFVAAFFRRWKPNSFWGSFFDS